jgi:hypothetical protein
MGLWTTTIHKLVLAISIMNLLVGAYPIHHSKTLTFCTLMNHKTKQILIHQTITSWTPTASQLLQEQILILVIIDLGFVNASIVVLVPKDSLNLQVVRILVLMVLILMLMLVLMLKTINGPHRSGKFNWTWEGFLVPCSSLTKQTKTTITTIIDKSGNKPLWIFLVRQQSGLHSNLN